MKAEVPICPACGGALKLNEGLATALCKYCGNTVIIQEAIKQGKVSVDGIPTLQDHINTGYTFLDIGQFDRAFQSFEQALSLAPNNYRVWWGIVLAGTENFTSYGSSIYKEEAQNAIRFTEDEEAIQEMRQRFNAYIEQVNSFLDSKYNDTSWKNQGKKKKWGR